MKHTKNNSSQVFNLKLKKENPPTVIRSDGQETRNWIIECAGKLFARDGYDKTTSKSICTMADVNLAAVNYHFGSRDGLYLAVLEEIQNRITELNSLSRIKNSPISSREKIETFLDFFISSVFKKNNWPVQLWTRELMEPSPFLQLVVPKKILPKFSVVVSIFSEYLNLPEEDPRLYTAILSTLAPFSIVSLGQNHPLASHSPIKIPQRQLIRLLRANALLTLQALRDTTAVADKAQSCNLAVPDE